MDKNFINVINDHLSISLKKVNIIDVKKSFTIDKPLLFLKKLLLQELDKQILVY